MSNILNKILATKSLEIAEAKKNVSIEDLRNKSSDIDKTKRFYSSIKR